MATDPNSVLGQSEVIHNALSSFFNQAGQRVQSGGEFPSVSDIAASLVYTELLRLATQSSSQAANLIAGSAVETVHLAAAVLREYNMRAKSKAEYYLDGANDHTVDSQYYNALKYQRTANLKGSAAGSTLTQ